MADEKRLIDANALFKAIKADKVAWRFGVPNTLGLLFDKLRLIIKEQPTVDAVEVVRCKDCKKGHPELAPNGGVWCAVWNHVFRDDEFCSKGERKDND